MRGERLRGWGDGEEEGRGGCYEGGRFKSREWSGEEGGSRLVVFNFFMGSFLSRQNPFL